MSKSADNIHHVSDSHFGIAYDPEDLISKIKVSEPESPHNIELPNIYAHKDGGSKVSMNQDKFELFLDVKQFKPEELTVSIVGVHAFTVEGDHAERDIQGGRVAERHFNKKYFVPPAFDCEKIKSTLSSDMILAITIPRLNPEDNVDKVVVPIEQTGEPATDEMNKRVEATKKENN